MVILPFLYKDKSQRLVAMVGSLSSAGALTDTSELKSGVQTWAATRGQAGEQKTNRMQITSCQQVSWIT